jgi:hypothetical protein
VSGFCPDGYVPTQGAIVRAAEYWFPERIAALERAAAPPSETKPDHSLEALARALSPPSVIPEALRHEFQDIVSETIHRLRNFLHRDQLKAYYFENDGCRSLPREFWATAHADGVMESGTYWPCGRPTRWHEQRPNHPLFVKQSELDALLSDQSAKKATLLKSKIPELVAAMRKFDKRLNRKEQREALRKLPEFERYHLTDDVFREAEKQVPRKPGRKPLDPEQ